MRLLDKIHAHLDIELTSYSRRTLPKLNERIKSIDWSTGEDGFQFHMNYYDEPITDEALHSIQYENDTITIISNEGTEITFFSEGGFNVENLMYCVLEFEKVNRPKMIRMGEVDIYFIYFGGLVKVKDAGPHTFMIDWEQ